MSKIEVDAIDKQSGSTLTLGGSGTAVTLACGATQSGFGRTGTVDWQTSIKTAATFSASNGEGYFVDTSSNAVTANLPAGSVGAIVAFKDYAQNFGTNALTIAANGSDKIQGQTFDLTVDAEGAAVTLVFGDATKGWQAVNSNEVINDAKFITATGGSVATVCTNFKVHTFTGPGTFCVSCAGNTAGSNKISYMVIAGGGGGGGSEGGGAGGAGGYRESKSPDTPYTASPLDETNGLPVSVQSYPITVGGGGAGSPGPANPPGGTQGASSVFSTITSAGGGFGNQHCMPAPGGSGGSGGGAGARQGASGGAGNTPSVSPPQGNNGGSSAPGSTPSGIDAGGGGGGAGGVGQNAANCTSGDGGAGTTTSINGTPTARAGGGGGGNEGNHQSTATAGGGAGGYLGNAATAGTVNTGGGGGGSGTNTPGAGFSGGSGIVIIRYKFQ